MNNDLVKRIAVCDMLHDEMGAWGNCADEIEALLKANDALWEIPAVDAVEVVHGEWEDYHFVKVDCPKSGFPTVKCSVCEIAFCDLINNHHFMYHYCPNCGAKMDGERKDNYDPT